jgi:hypothetical protein
MNVSLAQKGEKVPVLNAIDRLSEVGELADIRIVENYIEKLEEYEFSANKQANTTLKVIDLCSKVIETFYDNRDEYSLDDARVSEYELAKKVLQLFGVDE